MVSLEGSKIECKVTVIWSAHALLGEGPCWDNRYRRLIWLDIKGKQLHVWLPDTRIRKSWSLSCMVSSVVVPSSLWSTPDELEGDAYLCCRDDGLYWLGIGRDSLDFVKIIDPEASNSENRYNDGKIGPDGRYYSGTMHAAETKATGALYAFSNEGSYCLIDSGYLVPNGPAFAPDGQIMYHNDSGRRMVYAFSLDANGRWVNKRPLCKFPEGYGVPDGMITDMDGNLWIAMWDGWGIVKLSPSGRILGKLDLPTARCTSLVALPGKRLEFYVTSARIGLDEQDRLAGALFHVAVST